MPVSGWILPEREISRSPNYEHGRGGLVADTVVLHYTAGPGNAEKAAKVFANPERDASAHFVIGRDGGRRQCVSLLDTAWHAGDGMLNANGAGPLVPKVKRSVNRRSVGIELCNLGWAILSQPGFVDMPQERIFTGRHRNPRSSSRKWETFPDAQIEFLRTLLFMLTKTMPTLRFVTGHEDVTHYDIDGRRGSKLDPGPAFPWDRIDDLGLTRLVYDFNAKAWVEHGNETTVVDGLVEEVTNPIDVEDCEP